MTNPEVALIMLVLFIILVLLGFPIAFTLLAMGVGFGYFAYHREGSIEVFSDIFNNNIFYLLNQNTYSVMENPILVAIPLFLFMGYVVERANIIDKLFFSLYMAARNLPGSLAIAALITCAVFSTASGIVGAVVTLMGLLAFPAMANANYDKSFAAGVICAGGTLGILIPPSIMLIVYAAIADLSPLRLYAAAIFPGLLLAGLYIVYVIFRVWYNPALAPKPTTDNPPPPREIYIDLLKSFVPLTVLIALVLGSILGGLATPAEAAAMGALGGIVLAVLYQSMSWVKLKESVFFNCQSHCNGLLAVRRFMDVCLCVFIPRRARHYCRFCWWAGYGTMAVSNSCTVDHLSARLASRVVGDTNHLCANLLTIARSVWCEPLFLCDADSIKSTNFFLDSPYGYVGLLFKRGSKKSD